MGQDVSLQDNQLWDKLQLINQKEQIYFHCTFKSYFTKQVTIGRTQKQIDYQYDIYCFRNKHSAFLPTVILLENQQSQYFGCVNGQRSTYLLEIPAENLIQKKNISVNSSFKYLLKLLRSFELLYQKFGYFSPQSQLIFFDKNQEAKAWINSDIRITRTQSYPNIIKGRFYQNKLIRQLLSILDNHTDIRKGFKYQQLLIYQHISFQQAFNILTWQRIMKFTQNNSIVESKIKQKEIKIERDSIRSQKITNVSNIQKQKIRNIFIQQQNYIKGNKKIHFKRSSGYSKTNAGLSTAPFSPRNEKKQKVNFNSQVNIVSPSSNQSQSKNIQKFIQIIDRDQVNRSKIKSNLSSQINQSDFYCSISQEQNKSNYTKPHIKSGHRRNQTEINLQNNLYGQEWVKNLQKNQSIFNIVGTTKSIASVKSKDYTDEILQDLQKIIKKYKNIR